MDSSTGETGSCCSSSSSIPFFFFDFMYIHFYFLSCGCRHDTCLYQKRREKEIRVRETYKFLLQVFFFIISSFFFTLVFQSGSSLVFAKTLLMLMMMIPQHLASLLGSRRISSFSSLAMLLDDKSLV